jgi:rhodanese-related sulfurtransferase
LRRKIGRTRHRIVLPGGIHGPEKECNVILRWFRRVNWSRGFVLITLPFATGCSEADGDGASTAGASTATVAARGHGAAEVLADAPAKTADGVAVVSREQVLQLLDSDDGPVVIDVRSREEYRSGHLPAAINVPYDLIGERADDLRQFDERGIVLYCRTGRRAGIAARTLQEAGFENLMDLDGHMVEWVNAELPLEPAAD